MIKELIIIAVRLYAQGNPRIESQCTSPDHQNIIPISAHSLSRGKDTEEWKKSCGRGERDAESIG